MPGLENIMYRVVPLFMLFTHLCFTVAWCYVWLRHEHRNGHHYSIVTHVLQCQMPHAHTRTFTDVSEEQKLNSGFRWTKTRWEWLSITFATWCIKKRSRKTTAGWWWISMNYKIYISLLLYFHTWCDFDALFFPVRINFIHVRTPLFFKQTVLCVAMNILLYSTIISGLMEGIHFSCT